MIELDLEDIDKILIGCAFMGTGGGGKLERGRRIVENAVKQYKRRLKVISVDELGDDELTCSVFGVGSIAPLDKRGVGKYWGLETTLAIRKLENLLEREVSAIVPIELGAGSTGRAIATAISLDIPIVNGDYSGRAFPELIQCSPAIYGGKLCPIVACDEYGDVITINEVANPSNIEVIARWLSVAVMKSLKSQVLGCSGLPNQGRQVKKLIVRDTISFCLKIGEVISSSRESKEDVVDSLLRCTSGYLLFKGRVVSKKWEDREGFMYGESTILGIEEFSGHTFKIWFKNENHITWLDDRPYVTSPDLITVIDRSLGMPITNEELSEGNLVAVIGLKAPQIYRSGKGLEVLNPKHFNFDIEYVPIEERVKETAI